MKVTKIKGGATLTTFRRTEHHDYYEASIYIQEMYVGISASGETKAEAKAALKEKVKQIIDRLNEELK